MYNPFEARKGGGIALEKTRFLSRLIMQNTGFEPSESMKISDLTHLTTFQVIGFGARKSCAINRLPVALQNPKNDTNDDHHQHIDDDDDDDDDNS